MQLANMADNNKFKLFDSVVSTVKIKDGIPENTRGAIVHNFSDDNNYMVEFFDKEHKTISVETVSANQLKK